MAGSDDLLGDDAEFDKFAEEYERRRDALNERISDYMDEEEFDEEYAAQLLLDLAINMRMAAYAQSVEQPSVGGVRLDLDRFRGEVDAFVREAKKSADEYIAAVKAARAAADAEDGST